MTLPEPNTTEELKWFALAMGWEKHPVYDYFVNDGRTRVSAPNPRKSPADALELAEKLNLSVHRDRQSGKWTVWARKQPHVGDFCTAICEASKAYLESQKSVGGEGESPE